MDSTDNFLNSFGDPAPNSHESLDTIVERPGALDAFVSDFGDKMETHFFYGGTEELKFDRDEWKWYRVGELGNLEPLYGVTNVVKRADNPAALIPWAALMMYNKLLRTIPTYTSPLGVFVPEMTLNEFIRIALAAKSAHKEVFEDAGDCGKMAHKCLEINIKKALLTPEKKLQELTDLPTDIRAVSCTQAAKGWADAHNIRWVEAEKPVYSKEFGFCGTMDGLCLADSCADVLCCPKPFKDVLSVVDFKSSNRLHISYVFQVASYKRAKQEETRLVIPHCWILRLGKENEVFEVWHLIEEDFEDDFAGYLACLELLKIVDKVEERISNQKHAITAVKKEQRAEAKSLAKAEEKLRKATEKAEKKIKRAEEKAKIKAEAKAERGKLKSVIINPVVIPTGGPNGMLSEDTFTPIDIPTEEI